MTPRVGSTVCALSVLGWSWDPWDCDELTKSGRVAPSAGSSADRADTAVVDLPSKGRSEDEGGTVAQNDDDPVTLTTIDTTAPLTDGDMNVLRVLLAQAPTAITVTTVGADDGFEAWLVGSAEQ